MKKGLAIVIGIVSLMGLGACDFSFSDVTHFTTPTVHPALTHPTGWDYKYSYSSDYPGFVLQNKNDGVMDYSVPQYVNTIDGIYNNYSTTITPSDRMPLTVTLTFRHSNTSWQPDGQNTVVPVSTAIGSDNTVGTLNKFETTFTNDTNHDYVVYIDFSSTQSFFNSYLWEFDLSGNLVSSSGDYTFYSNVFLSFSVHSKSIMRFVSYMTEALYFNAFYLNDLGVSTAYTNGSSAGYSDGYEAGESGGYSSAYQDGYDDGAGDAYSMGVSDGLDLANQAWTLQDGFEDIAGMFINIVLLFASFKIFGVSLMDLLVLLVSVVLIVWILKMVRG